LEFLKTNSTLSEITLNRNHIRPSQLADVLEMNSSINRLSLADNDLGTRDITCLTDVLKGHASISTLGLHYNCLDNYAIRLLRDALKENISITELNVSVNKLSIQGRNALLSLTKHNQSLEQIDIHSNSFNEYNTDVHIKTAFEPLDHGVFYRSRNRPFDSTLIMYDG